MADYRETTGTVTTWRRIGRVQIDNPLNNPDKTIRFLEEDAVRKADGSVTVSRASEVALPLIPLTYSFPLRNPNTGDLIGAQTATLNDLYTALYSLYRDLAARRDAGTL